MPADPVADFFLAHGVNPQALVLAIAAVVVLASWGYFGWAVWKGFVR